MTAAAEKPRAAMAGTATRADYLHIHINIISFSFFFFYYLGSNGTDGVHV
jgi:hypothetical protein